MRTKANESLQEQMERLRRKLQRMACHERKYVGNDSTHFEGVCKGQWLAYDWCASRLLEIIKAEKRKDQR